MINISGLTVAFGGVVALSDLTVKLDGDIVGIIGPNGAGKTTFINALSGFVTPRQGAITAFGSELLKLKPHERARWGLRRSFQREQVVDNLSVADNVRVVADHVGLNGEDSQLSIDKALQLTGMQDKADVRAENLNSFERRMTEIARTLAGGPKLILLDEPGAGFSQSETERLREVILSIRKSVDAMVFLIDHDVDLIQAVCGKTMVLDFGRLVAYGPTAEVLQDPKVKAVYLGVTEI